MDFGGISVKRLLYQLFLISQHILTCSWKRADSLLTGQIYSNFDAKAIYLICVVLFDVGSAVCGAAPNINALIIGRAICGLGGSGAYAGVMIILSVMTDVSERAAYLGTTGLTWGTGVVLGPIIGGALTNSSATWRWAFYINLVIGGVAIPICCWLIPTCDPTRGVAMKTRANKIDIPGTILMIAFMTSLLMAISFGGLLYPWSSTQIIVLFVVFGVTIIAFGGQQVYCLGTTVENRSFPIPFLWNKELMLLFIIEACASILTFIPMYFIPLYFQFAKNDTALKTGVRLLPLTAFLVSTIVGTGVWMKYSPRYMPWMLCGSALGLIGSSLLYTVDITTSNEKMYGYSILIGTGAGLYVTLVFTAAQSQVKPVLIPIAVGFITYSQLAASGIALAVANSIFLNTAMNSIAAVLPNISRTDVQGIVLRTSVAILDSLDPGVRRQIVEIIVSSLNNAYIITIMSGAISLVLSLFLKRKKMNINS